MAEYELLTERSIKTCIEFAPRTRLLVSFILVVLKIQKYYGLLQVF